VPRKSRKLLSLKWASKRFQAIRENARDSKNPEATRRNHGIIHCTNAPDDNLTSSKYTIASGTKNQSTLGSKFVEK